MQQSCFTRARRSHDSDRFARSAENEIPRKTSMRSPPGDKKALRKSRDGKPKVQSRKSKVAASDKQVRLIRESSRLPSEML